MIHRRDYRPVEDHDIESAIRGLHLGQHSTVQLKRLKEEHDAIDMFASAVISAACQRLMDENDAVLDVLGLLGAEGNLTEEAKKEYGK